jgi:hypothetical protein
MLWLAITSKRRARARRRWCRRGTSWRACENRWHRPDGNDQDVCRCALRPAPDDGACFVNPCKRKRTSHWIVPVLVARANGLVRIKSSARCAAGFRSGPMSAMGHSRPMRSKPREHVCLLLPESGQTARCLAMSALCQSRSNAPQQKRSLIRSPPW